MKYYSPSKRTESVKNSPIPRYVVWEIFPKLENGVCSVQFSSVQFSSVQFSSVKINFILLNFDFHTVLVYTYD